MHPAFQVAIFAAMKPNQGNVTLSGGTNIAFNFMANAVATFKVDNDGKMYSRDNGGSYGQIATATDWVRPATEAPGLYEVRYSNATGDTADISATAAEDQWQALSTGDFVINVTDTTPLPALKSASFTLEIRLDGGPLLDSASYTLTADREDA